MAVKVIVGGSFRKTEEYLRKIQGGIQPDSLDRYGEMGVEALSKATPVATGKTAASWSYRIKKEQTSTSIEWHNSNLDNGTPIVVLLQYGHGTKNGGYVEGRDFINPAMREVFDKIAADAFRALENSRR